MGSGESRYPFGGKEGLRKHEKFWIFSQKKIECWRGSRLESVMAEAKRREETERGLNLDLVLFL